MKQIGEREPTPAGLQGKYKKIKYESIFFV